MPWCTIAMSRVTLAVLNKYIDLLEDTIIGNDLHKRPALIFSCDESGFPLVYQPGKRIPGKGQKHVLTSDSKSRVTVLACVNTAEYEIPPLVIMLVLTLQSYCIRGNTWHNVCFVTR